MGHCTRRIEVIYVELRATRLTTFWVLIIYYVILIDDLTWKTLVLFPVQDMTDATPANVVALRVFRNAFLISVALFAQINVRQAKVPGRVRVLPNGAYTNAVTAVGIVPDAVIRESAVLPKVARLVATPFPLNVVCPLSTLTRIGPTFRIRTQHVLALVIVLAVVSNGRCNWGSWVKIKVKLLISLECIIQPFFF